MNIEVRKTIALAFAGALLIFTGISMYFKLDIPEPFKTLVGIVIGYYFGKATALDVPGETNKVTDQSATNLGNEVNINDTN